MTDEQHPPPHQHHTVLEQKKVIRRRFLESVASVLLALAIIALPISLSRIIQTGLHFNHIVHSGCAALILIVFFLRKKLSDPWLIVSVLFIFTVLSISAFLQYGIVSAGFYFAAACIFIAGVTLGLLSGVICAVFYAVAASVIAYLWTSGYLVFPVDVGEYILLPRVWATLGLGFLVTTAVFFVSATGFFTGLADLAETIEKQKQKIEEHTAKLTRANRELEAAMKEIKTLHGLLPICSGCKKIRDDKGYWQHVEHYVQHHTQAEFTHSLCPDCLKELYPDIAERLLAKLDENKPE